MASDEIGCTLAEAAEARGYSDYLAAAAADDAPGVHVVYINTSLRTKALAHAAVPTITCTSSNLVQTVLQARDTLGRLRTTMHSGSLFFRPIQTVLQARPRRCPPARGAAWGGCRAWRAW
jgi:hypothetical protein